jgi:hypothetical protein
MTLERELYRKFKNESASKQEAEKAKYNIVALDQIPNIRKYLEYLKDNNDIYDLYAYGAYANVKAMDTARERETVIQISLIPFYDNSYKRGGWGTRYSYFMKLDELGPKGNVISGKIHVKEIHSDNAADQDQYAQAAETVLKAMLNEANLELINDNDAPDRQVFSKLFTEMSMLNEDTVDLSTLGDSIEDWKTAASVITASGEKWFQGEYGYEISDPDGKYYFEAGDEDGIYSIATAVGDEVREFNTKEEFFDFLEEIGLTAEGLFEEPAQDDTANEPKTNAWVEFKFHDILRYDIADGYVGVYAFDSEPAQIQVAAIRRDIEDLGTASFGLDDQAKIREFIEKAAKLLGASDQDAKTIAETCPLETLYVYTDYPELK